MCWIYTGVHVLENGWDFWVYVIFEECFSPDSWGWSSLQMIIALFCVDVFFLQDHSSSKWYVIWIRLRRFTHPQKKLVSEISTKHNFQALLQTWQFEYREIQLSVVKISRVFQPLLTCSITICKVFLANNGPPHMDHEAWFVCCYHYHSHCHYYSCIHYPSWKLIAGTGRFDSFSFGGVGGFQA